MRRPRSRIGFELASVALILSCLAGSMALVVAIHRQKTSKKPDRVAVALAPIPPAPEPVKPAAVPIIEPTPEPEPAPEPTPVDPTLAVIARLTSAEAEQLLEASRADRRTAALEAARRDARLESERLRRRESLVHAQLSSLDAKVRKLETEADALAFERDALLKERDARKAMAARARSRPAQAILPHKGPNGTWRRPIVIECRDGMAILQPQGTSFGLLELDNSGFGPLSNPFTATVAREAIRIQGQATPDGKPVVPYIFFIVRPDGIRPYYEARSRLEPLGITFGYELADQDWQIDFPDLDDTQSWDGSVPSRTFGDDPMAATPNAPSPRAGRSREDDEFPAFTSSRGKPAGGSGAGGDFTWPAAAPYLRGVDHSRQYPGFGTADRGPGTGPSASRLGGVDPMAGSPDGSTGGLPPMGADPLGPGSVASASKGPNGGDPSPTLGDGTGSPGEMLVDRVVSEGSRITGAGPKGTNAPSRTDSEPGQDFVWNGSNTAAGKPGRGAQNPRQAPALAQAGSGDVPDRSAPTRAGNLPDFDPSSSSGNPATGAQEADPTQPGGSGSADGQARSASSPGSTATSTAATADPASQGAGKTPQRVLGPGTSPPTSMTPPPGMTGLAMGSPPPVLPSPGMPTPVVPDLSAGTSKAKVKPMVLPELPRGVVDRTYEIVVVCGPRGVIVQPGGYRVTADALNDRDGLLKKQIVALVKAKRAAEPRVILEPSVRFLVQTGGFETYRAAKGQFLLSGLDYPVSTQVADPDPVSILPSEGW